MINTQYKTIHNLRHSATKSAMQYTVMQYTIMQYAEIKYDGFHHFHIILQYEWFASRIIPQVVWSPCDPIYSF